MTYNDLYMLPLAGKYFHLQIQWKTVFPRIFFKAWILNTFPNQIKVCNGRLAIVGLIPFYVQKYNKHDFSDPLIKNLHDRFKKLLLQLS